MPMTRSPSSTGAANGNTTGDYRLNAQHLSTPIPTASSPVPVPSTSARRTDTATSQHPAIRRPYLPPTISLTDFSGPIPAVSGSVNASRIFVDNGDVDMFSFQAPDDGPLVSVHRATTPATDWLAFRWLRLFTQANSTGRTCKVQAGRGLRFGQQKSGKLLSFRSASPTTSV